MNRRPLGFIMYILLAALTGFAVSTPTAANAAPLVTTDWMAKNLNAKGLVLIDVRTAVNYSVGHLPGALSLPYGQWEPKNEDRECNLMPSPAQMTELLKKMGVNNSSHVVIYDHGNTTSDTTKGTSAVWIMEAMGHKNVSYLNGGFTKWTFEGRVIVSAKTGEKPANPAPGDFVAKLDSSKVATLKDVTSSMKNKNAILLDVRNTDQHFGFKKRGDVERFGHIPGSLSWPADFMTHAGINRAPAYVLDKGDLKTMAKGVGLPWSWSKSENIIVYCNSSQFAGLGYFVLHDVLGYKNVKVYDASMLEYAADDNLPMTTFAWGFVTK
ncbi:MAG: rhodanese-like domain-containing protein [Desulfobulbaceae bacterium]|nr:rhodanese-like domain-containing protein [Desulfobulbaceae bacterium]